MGKNIEKIQNVKPAIEVKPGIALQVENAELKEKIKQLKKLIKEIKEKAKDQ